MDALFLYLAGSEGHQPRHWPTVPPRMPGGTARGLSARKTALALAVRAHGWELGVRWGCLPPELLGATDALRRAEEPRTNDLGG